MLRAFRFAAAIAACSLTGMWGADAAAGSPLGKSIDAFAGRDYQGQEHSLADYADHDVLVVAFLGTECPLAKLYGPRLQEIADAYAEQGVAVIGVNSNLQDSLTEMGAYARRGEISFPIIKDSGNAIADLFGAERTPEVFVLDAQRVIRYRGRIDDQYVVGIVRDAATRHDLREAVDELLAGEPVSVQETDALGCIIGRTREVNEDSPVTYSNQIARLFNDRCVECHRAGEIGPFPMTSYDDVAGWGEMIAEVVRERRMPPWHAHPDHGTFLNERRLTDAERDLIVTWVENGCPEGDPAELPEPRKFTEGWALPRAPDAVYAMRDTPVTVPADGGKEGVRYQYFEVDPGFTEDKWFNASEVQPGAREVVHHIIVFAKPEGDRRRRDWVFLTAYVPGLRLQGLLEGAAKRIPAGSTFVFEVHYTPNGREQQDLSRVGFNFVDADTVTHEVITTEVVKADFAIPPQESHAEFTAQSAAAPAPLTLVSMSPHMHLRGKSFRYELLLPDGGREVLLDVPEYDFNWQTRYVLAEPRELPAGTRMLCTAVFDNSEENLANPDPNATVKWGDQSWEEMMIGYFDVMIPRDESRESARRPVRTGIDADQILSRLDTDKDGAISRAEAGVNALLLASFDKIDADQDGMLQKKELGVVVEFLKKQLGSD